MTDVLKKPVHEALLDDTKIRELQDSGAYRDGVVRAQPKASQPLPKEETPPPVRKSKTGLVKFSPLKGFSPVKDAQETTKKASLRAKLRVLQESVSSPDAPCDTCKTSACCSAFAVEITKTEYESGFYEPYAVKITPEMVKQLQGRILRPVTFGGPFLRQEEESYFYLEGRVGQPCSFLGEDNRCTIYDIRPIVCRAYSCANDERITEGMRQGTEPIPLSDAHVESLRKEKDA